MYRINIREEEEEEKNGESAPFSASKDVRADGDGEEAPQERFWYVTASPLEHAKSYNVSVVAVSRDGVEGE